MRLLTLLKDAPELVEYAHFNDKYPGEATRLLTLLKDAPAYKELKKKDIKLIIYNNRKKVNKDLTDDLEIEV